MRCFYNQAGTAEPTIYAQYLYDGSGNRVKKIVRTQGGNYESTTYIGGMFESKTNGTEEQTIAHVMDGNSRIAMIREGDDMGDTTPAVKYNIENNIYSSTIILDNVGSIVNTQEYYPFGETSFGSYAKKRMNMLEKNATKKVDCIITVLGTTPHGRASLLAWIRWLKNMLN